MAAAATGDGAPSLAPCRATTATASAPSAPSTGQRTSRRTVADTALLVTEPARVGIAMLAVPGGAVTHLVREGWTGGASATDTLPALGVLAAWTAAGVLVAVRTFRWDPRR